MLVVEALFIIQVYLGKLLLLGMLAMSQYVYNVQWGLTKEPSEKVFYPIAVTHVHCLLLTPKATTFRYSPWPTEITTKSFQVYSDCEPAYWFGVFS